MTLEELKKHSDKRDDVIEGKIDKIDDFLHNGLSEKVIKGITDYLNERTANRVKWFFKIFFSALILSLIGAGIKYFILRG